MKVEEIEDLVNNFSFCPECGSREGIWLIVKGDKAYAQCKSCGVNFQISKVLPKAKGKKPKGILRFLNK